MRAYPNDLPYRIIGTFKDTITNNFFEIIFLCDATAFLQTEENPEYALMYMFEEVYEDYLDYFVDPTEVEYIRYRAQLRDIEPVLN